MKDAKEGLEQQEREGVGALPMPPAREVEALSVAAALVTELTGVENGRWKVSTQSSHYIFDFDARTVARHPGKRASAGINDTTRPLREIKQCRVGLSGAWTMHSEGGYTDPIDFYWQVCTEIRSIERIADHES